MSFADELRGIDPQKLKNEKAERIDEETIIRNQEKKNRLQNLVKTTFKIARENGYVTSDVFHGFWGYLSYKLGYNNDQTVCFVPCSLNELNISKKAQSNSKMTFYSISNIGVSCNSMVNKLSEMNRTSFINEKYYSDEFLSMLKDVLLEMGFKNVVCKRVEASYYEKENGFFFTRWKKRLTNVGYMECSL